MNTPWLISERYLNRGGGAERSSLPRFTAMDEDDLRLAYVTVCVWFLGLEEADVPAGCGLSGASASLVSATAAGWPPPWP